ncbi:MAG: endo-1,4-beta-xylanase [Treponema sp.]|uniref:endo-1,4-beta-xylanase n=1 Tax=Treponema sp. TaxID=166 RepID=UPI00298EA25C|nr:endo-1,4-beta-xylanase [Treponema sp.]MCQ2600442.1 endo-1,4-beta-xylanase [Treponema sp.]
MKKTFLVSVAFTSLLAVSCSQPSNGISRSQDNWLADSVPSIKQTYNDTFDYIGLAVEYGNFGLKCTGDKYTGTYTEDKSWGTPSEFYYSEVQQGVSKHANTITLGNELKPQFLLQWWDGDGSSQSKTTFTASNGKTIEVPDKLNGEALIYATLNAAKKAGVKMRGHVLTWHSQTPEGFFTENYKPVYDEHTKAITNFVSKEVMTARHEWYIKTVLDCVAQWEKANGFAGKETGNHLIWAWDVVNEAMADDAGTTYTGTNQNWLRGSTSQTKDKSPTDYPQGSRWYQIYGNEEFIINAFRFANAYAPADVKLCYNDYNEYVDFVDGYKTSAIEHIAKLIKEGTPQTIAGKSVSPRLDVIAMQSHVGTSWPSISEYESALKKFLAIADVHVSELDFNATSQNDAEKVYGEYLKMLKKYGKTYSGSHKIECVTIWGINNENSWINPNSDGNTTYPLLFSKTGETYDTNNSFWAVINSH